MPAPQKDPRIKAQNSLRKRKRKSRKKCKEQLGTLGRHYFREFVNLHGRLPIETTALWAAAIAKVIGPKKGALASGEFCLDSLKEKRSQFGDWSMALTSGNFQHPTVRGRFFTLRIIELGGSKPPTWTGVLLLMYERSSGVLFHHLARSDTRRPLGGEFVWFALHKAITLLQGRPSDRSKVQIAPISNQQVTVAFPVDDLGNDIYPMFEQARNMYKEHVQEGETKMHVRGSPSHKVSMDIGMWSIKSFSGYRKMRLTLKKSTYEELQKELKEKAKQVSKNLRAIRTKHKKSSVDRESSNCAKSPSPNCPTWRPLFQTRAPYEYTSPQNENRSRTQGSL